MRRGTHLSMMSVFLIFLIIVWTLLFAVAATLSWLKGKGAEPPGAGAAAQSVAGLLSEADPEHGRNRFL